MISSLTKEKNYEEKIGWILASHPTILYINEMETQSALGSKEDHKPIGFVVHLSADHIPASPRPSFNFNNADWKIYRNKLDQWLNKIDINEAITTSDHIETYITKPPTP